MSSFDPYGPMTTSYAAVLDALPVVSYMSDARGRITYLSSGNRATALDRDAVLQGGFGEIAHPDDRASTDRAWRASLETGSPYRETYRVRSPDGTVRWITNSADVVHDGAGAVLGWFGVIADVDAERTAEEGMSRAVASSAVHAFEAEARAQFVERLMDSTDDCIKVMDVDARLTTISANGRAALSNVGFDAVPGADWLSLWTGDDLRDAIETIEGARRGEKGRFTGRLTANGRERWWESTVTPIVGRRGETEQILVVSRDVTEARSARKALEAAYTRERHIAVTLQEASLPQILPRVDHLYLSAEYRPGDDEATIGGDWYDAFVLRDGRIAFTIGDVLGHGLSAAVTMSKVRQAMRAVALVVPDVNAMLDVADRTVRDESDETYATAMAGIFDPATHEYVFASAGHPGPVLRHPDGRIEEFISPGLLLGLRPPDQTGSVRIDAPPGSALVFYTDGLSEATRDGEEGSRRIHEAMADASVAAASEPARALVEHVLRGKPSADDVALLVAEVGPSERFDDRMRSVERIGPPESADRKRGAPSHAA